MKKTIDITKIKKHCNTAVELYDAGKLGKAATENQKAIKMLKRFLEILEHNQMCYEVNEFLLGNSAITRKPKKKK